MHCSKMTVSSLITVVVLFLSLLKPADADRCYYSTALFNYDQCPKLDVESFGALHHLRSTCSSLECTLSCQKNAIGACASTGIFRTYDMDLYKVYFRYACSDPEGFTRALNDCEGDVSSNQCVANKNSELYEALFDYLSNPNDLDGYYSSFCRALRNYRTCAPEPPLKPTPTCSAAQAEILNNILDLDSSVSGCGLEHSNHLFSVYDGPLQCGDDTTPPTTPTPPTRPNPVSTGMSSTVAARTTSAFRRGINSSTAPQGNCLGLLVFVILSMI